MASYYTCHKDTYTVVLLLYSVFMDSSCNTRKEKGVGREKSRVGGLCCPGMSSRADLIDLSQSLKLSIQPLFYHFFFPVLLPSPGNCPACHSLLKIFTVLPNPILFFFSQTCLLLIKPVCVEKF